MNNYYTIKQIEEFVNPDGLKDAGYAENSIKGMRVSVSKLKKAFGQAVSFESAHLMRSADSFIKIFLNAYRGEPSTYMYIAKIKAVFKVMDGGKKRPTKTYKLPGKSFTALKLALQNTNAYKARRYAEARKHTFASGQIKTSNGAPENFGALEFVLAYFVTLISLQAGIFIGGLIY